MVDIKETFLNKYIEFEKGLNGQTGTPIHDARKAAIQQFEQAGLPGPKNEEYKYTHLSRTLRKDLDLGLDSFSSKLSENEMEKFHFPHDEANVLYFVNGFFKSDLSKILSPESEFKVTELGTAFEDYQQDIQEIFGKHLNHQDAFAALNTALTNQGVFIKVEKGKALSHPIIIYNITDTSEGNVIYYPRNIVLLGENSHARIVETFQTFGKGKSFINQAGEIIVKQSANLEYYKIQEENKETLRVDNTQIVQYRDSVFNAFTFTFEGKMIRNNLSIRLVDEHCESHMFGLYLVKGNSHVDNHTVVDHLKPDSFSNEIYKGVLDENSTGVFNGKIYVRQDAQKTNAFQSNKNILLTETASINTKPQLEIWANDVKCSHGCTTGQLDEEQMFYLQTRGISKESARAILLTAFAEDVLENIKIDFIRKHLHNTISSRLKH